VRPQKEHLRGFSLRHFGRSESGIVLERRMRLASQFDKSLFRRLTAVFAVLLIAGFGFVQSVHLHDESAPSSATHSHCALCAFSHSPAVATAARSAPIPVLSFTSLQSVEPQLHSRLLLPSVSIRPPPIL
jgi:hypothetical protein